MRIAVNLVFLALLIAVVSGHNSIKARFYNKVGDLKDALHGLKTATLEAVKNKKGKGIEVETDPGWDEEVAPPTTKCHTVFDEVWQEECGTKFNNTCRLETKPVCTTIRAKECTPEPQESCTWVMENKCKTISVPSCSVDWEKRCTSDPICTTVQTKVCSDVEKDVCVEHMDKVCTMTSVKVCRKVAVREEVEDWPTTEVEDWPATKGKGEKGHVKNKAKKAHFKSADLDKIEDITDAKIDHIEAKAAKGAQKGAKGAQKGEVDDVPHKVHKRSVLGQKEDFKHAVMDKIEDITDAKVDHIEAKVMEKNGKIRVKVKNREEAYRGPC